MIYKFIYYIAKRYSIAKMFEIGKVQTEEGREEGGERERERERERDRTNCYI